MKLFLNSLTDYGIIALLTLAKHRKQLNARVAKLVDAPGLGPDASNGMGVQVPLGAPSLVFLKKRP